MPTSARTISFIDSWVNLLDTKIGVGKFTVGIDPLFSLIPGIGGFIPTIFTGYLIVLAIKAQAPTHVTAKLTGYLAIDLLISAVPILGVPFDALYHANAKSWRLLKPYVIDSTAARHFKDEPIIIEGEKIE
ncbi:MAG: DUF4112 domain-containing protein [Bacteroidia bacterium]|jgi:hypothetical protein